ncbi:MAG: retropepsin-like aspartic protease [Candidatus Binatia bacterium]
MGVIRKSLQLIGRRRKTEVECLFDTGASSSFIHPELVHALGLSTADLPKPVRIRLGKGSTQVSQIAAVTIRLNGAILADSPYVMPGLTEPYILGAEFLERYDIRLDPKRRRLLLPPKRRLSLILV